MYVHTSQKTPIWLDAVPIMKNIKQCPKAEVVEIGTARGKFS